MITFDGGSAPVNPPNPPRPPRPPNPPSPSIPMPAPSPDIKGFAEFYHRNYIISTIYTYMQGLSYLKGEGGGGGTGVSLRPSDLQTICAHLDAVQVGQGGRGLFDGAHFAESVMSIGADPGTQHALLVLCEAQLPQSHVHEVTQLRHSDTRGQVADVSAR